MNAQRMTLTELRTVVAETHSPDAAHALEEREAYTDAINHCTGNRWSEIRPQHVTDTQDVPTGFAN